MRIEICLCEFNNVMVRIIQGRAHMRNLGGFFKLLKFAFNSESPPLVALWVIVMLMKETVGSHSLIS